MQELDEPDPPFLFMKLPSELRVSAFNFIACFSCPTLEFGRKTMDIFLVSMTYYPANQPVHIEAVEITEKNIYHFHSVLSQVKRARASEV